MATGLEEIPVQSICPELPIVHLVVEAASVGHVVRVGCGTARDRSFLTHRLLKSPSASVYRIVASEQDRGAIVATTEATKHGGHIGYLLEAMGHSDLDGLLASEMGRLRDRGVEVVLAWSYPWSANHRSLRKAGLPRDFRPGMQGFIPLSFNASLNQSAS
jgi:hypothetical protein